MKIKELKEAIKDLPDDMELIISGVGGNQLRADFMGDGIARESPDGTLILKPTELDCWGKPNFESKDEYNNKLEEWNKIRNLNGEIVECFMIEHDY